MLREFAQLVEGAVEGKLAVQVIEPEILTGEDKKKSIGCWWDVGQLCVEPWIGIGC